MTLSAASTLCVFLIVVSMTDLILAVEAVKDIGKRIEDCWRGGSVEELIQTAKSTYFKHPSKVSWMDEMVINWIDDNPKKVEDSPHESDVQELLDKIKEVGAQMTDFIKQLPNAIKELRDSIGL